jgi:hypothetical protein
MSTVRQRVLSAPGPSEEGANGDALDTGALNMDKAFRSTNRERGHRASSPV